MLKYLLTLFFCLFTVYAPAQSVQWASRLLDYSTELTPQKFAARQILGKPNVMPIGVESPTAWTPRRPNRRKEFIKVGFEQPMKIKQIVIIESFNPSVVQKVYAYDSAGGEHLVRTLNPGKLGKKGRMVYLFLKETDYKVAAIKLQLRPRAVKGYHSIDAIGISDSHIPIRPQINLAENLEKGRKAEPLSSLINSPYKELSPILSADGNFLFFSRKHHPGNMGGEYDSEDIWYAEWDEETQSWQKPKNAGFPLNNFGPNYISTIVPDGKYMIAILGNLYGLNGEMYSGLSMSYYTQSGWSFPIRVQVENEYNTSPKANFFLSNNRRIMLQAIEREDAFGDRDLYVSFLMNNDKWTEPINLGPDINTADEESSPYLAPDNKTLYFSTPGRIGYGKSDIYVTHRLDESWQNWSEPQNLGPAINSYRDELFFNVPETGKYAYFSREVDSANADIFRIELPLLIPEQRMITVKGMAYTSMTHLKAGDTVYFQAQGDSLQYKTLIDSVSGAYETQLPAGKKYFMYARQPLMLSVGYWLDLTQVEYGIDEIYQHVLLMPVDKLQRLILYHIQFEHGSNQLLSSSMPELKRLSEFMNHHPEIRIEIGGHTNQIGHPKYDYYLSHRRARVVYKYLISAGIDKSRLKYKGYGSQKPVKNYRQAARHLNNRIEVRVIK